MDLDEKGVNHYQPLFNFKRIIIKSSKTWQETWQVSCDQKVKKCDYTNRI
jgi:hypothetical protein